MTFSLGTKGQIFCKLNLSKKGKYEKKVKIEGKVKLIKKKSEKKFLFFFFKVKI